MSAAPAATAGRALRNALLLLAACLAVQLAAGPLAGRGLDPDGWLHGAAVLATGVAAIRLAGLLLFRFALPAARIATARIAEDLAVALASVAWALLYLRLAGVELGNLVTTSAVLTAIAAFAMQDTLGNVLGGLFLEFDRSLRTGDWVKLDDVSGQVVEVRWRHTAILTRNRERVIVPNSVLMKSRFTVIGNPEEAPVRWRRWIWFEADAAAPAGKVIDTARQAILGAEIPGVAPDPAPDCVLMEPAAGHFRYALRYFLDDPRRDDGTDSAVRVHLVAALRRAGISLALPEFFVHEVREGAAREAALRAQTRAERAAALHRIDLFSHLTAGEADTLAGRLVPAPFAAGDVVTRQGAVAHWLYLLADGEADVWVDTPGAPRRRVASLKAGSVFGEMGMMTGEPRRSTVTARTDLECYRLDKEAFAEILHSRPEIAEAMARVLAARSGELQHVIDGARAEASRPHEESLLEKIRAFFGLTPEPKSRPG